MKRAIHFVTQIQTVFYIIDLKKAQVVDQKQGNIELRDLTDDTFAEAARQIREALSSIEAEVSAEPGPDTGDEGEGGGGEGVPVAPAGGPIPTLSDESELPVGPEITA